jgi:hypothetical protein
MVSVQATEDFLVHLMEDCNLCAIHAKRVTISECAQTISQCFDRLPDLQVCMPTSQADLSFALC